MTETSPSSAATQRRLILIRHAKACEEDARGDHARSLSERGEADAKALGGWLKAKELRPDLVLCSSAARTRQTLAALGGNVPTILSDKMYLASVGDMLHAIQNTDDTVTTLMVICHNPGAHALLAMLVGEYHNDADADKVLLKFPTSACAVMTLPVAKWREVAPRCATLELLRY